MFGRVFCFAIARFAAHVRPVHVVGVGVCVRVWSVARVRFEVHFVLSVFFHLVW